MKVLFFKSKPHWPQNHVLKRRAEDLLNSSTNKKIIIEWFNRHRPVVTSSGYKYYALAVASLVKDTKKLSTIIKLGWHFGNFTPAEQNKYYKKYTKYLTETDHVKKIDNDLWNEDIVSAKNSFKYINFGYQNSRDTQIALIEQKENAIYLRLDQMNIILLV